MGLQLVEISRTGMCCGQFQSEASTVVTTDCSGRARYAGSRRRATGAGQIADTEIPPVAAVIGIGDRPFVRHLHEAGRAAAELHIAPAGLRDRRLVEAVADALAAGDLVEILADCGDREMPIPLVHSEGRRAAVKIRAFIDLAAKTLRRDADRLAAL